MSAPASVTPDSDTPFVDFRQVWLAYNDELLAKKEFAVEDINVQTRPGEFTRSSGPPVAASPPS